MQSKIARSGGCQRLRSARLYLHVFAALSILAAVARA